VGHSSRTRQVVSELCSYIWIPAETAALVSRHAIMVHCDAARRCIIMWNLWMRSRNYFTAAKQACNIFTCARLISAQLQRLCSYVECFTNSVNVTLFCQYFRNSLLLRKRNQLHWQEHVWELVICTRSGGCQHVSVLGRSSPKWEPISFLSLCYSCVVEIIRLYSNCYLRSHFVDF